MQVMIVQQARYSEQITYTHEVRSQFFHHLVLRAGIGEIQLSTEDRREDVELLRNVVTGCGRARRRGAADGPQARGDTLEIQCDPALDTV